MKVVVADDQTAVREGLVTLIGTMPGIEVVAAASNGEEAVAAVAAFSPDVVLMDLRMPVLDGAAATRAICSAGGATRVVVLTTYADDDSVLGALQAGAIGYLTKDAGRDDIRRAIEAAAAGQSLLDPVVQAKLVAFAARSSTAREVGAGRQPASLPDRLTEKEAEVLGLIAAGLSNGEIAGRLFVSEATVKTHVNHIFAKTRSRDRAQAVAYAHRHGLAGT